MRTVTLNNGVNIPMIGLGVFRTPDGETAANCVRWALETGYGHIDTAALYDNETGVGMGMKESGLKREEIFLTTKVWNDDIRAGKTREAFEASLKRLDVDYVDLYLIHWPADGFEQAWKEMERLYEEGMIRAIGVSNFNPHHIERIDAIGNVEPAVNQIESNPYFQNQDVIDYCLQRGIYVEAWSPLGGAGGDIRVDATLTEIGGKYGKSPVQVIVRWNLQRGVIVLPKSAHKERIEANFDVEDFTLTEEEMRKIRNLDQNMRTGADPENFPF